MRALFVPNINDQVLIEGENFHHLKVIRIKLNESVLLLNGLGEYHFCKVIEINTKNIVLKREYNKKIERKNQIDLALALPKKKALEETIVAAVELGVNRIIPLITNYSERYTISTLRLDHLIKSAMIQSNNPFFLEYQEAISLDQLKSLFINYQQICYFTPNANPQKIKTNLKSLAIIGSEGGLSKEEEMLLNDTIKIGLPSYILRVPTAAIAAIGFMGSL